LDLLFESRIQSANSVESYGGFVEHVHYWTDTTGYLGLDKPHPRTDLQLTMVALHGTALKTGTLEQDSELLYNQLLAS